MKIKKRIIITFVVILLFVAGGFFTFSVLNDENKLSASEKKWIHNQLNTIQNVNVLNDVNLFGNTGAGVFYEFLNDIEREYKLQINPVTFNYGELVNGITLGAKTTINELDQVFYEDHFVLVGKKAEIISSYTNYVGKRIGIISGDLSYVTRFVNQTNVSFTSYENKESILNAMRENTDIDYMIVPLTLYLDEILKNDFTIIHHLSDAKFYYTISGDGSELSSILKKYYHLWASENFDEYFKREEFLLFTSALGISETEVDAMQSVTYQYGFVNNSPYEILMSGNYGGIVASYLSDFEKFSQIEFHFKKYRSFNKLKNAISRGEVDLYFNYYQIMDQYHSINSNLLVEYSVIANQKNNLVVHSINSLIGQSVYVQENSSIEAYLRTIPGINIKTYQSEKELKKLNKKDVIIVLDKHIFDFYSKDKLDHYTERYHSSLNETLSFKSKVDSAFYKLLTKYLMVSDANQMVNKGMYHHYLTLKNGSVLGTIAKYILLSFTIIGIAFIIFYRKSKKIKVAKRIKRENKMKFIDQLTSLKNRNYLNEYINNWNNNTIYPQTMIVIDLNNIQFINDTLGYEEGDKQIQSAANILIKTQLDNSDMMRTDGNEFLIYLVGYTQKQVTNYIHKLNKEFKKLPYEYGAEFGYSMINDGIKTIEDAILEATEEMKKQKKKESEE